MGIVTPLSERDLAKDNIESLIKAYLYSMQDIQLVPKGDVLDQLTSIKREKIEVGPYPNVTLFEAANRIMTDLVILFGVHDLLDGKIPELRFEKYKVELGNEQKNEHDIHGNDANRELIGEAFNVAPSFFQGKKRTALKKLEASAQKKGNNPLILLLYNSDAVNEGYSFKSKENLFHLAVDVPKKYNEYMKSFRLK
ncbi:MAG: hypothetical protein AAFO07_10715 [Bacteroidota bacterium]